MPLANLTRSADRPAFLIRLASRLFSQAAPPLHAKPGWLPHAVSLDLYGMRSCLQTCVRVAYLVPHLRVDREFMRVPAPCVCVCTYGSISPCVCLCFSPQTPPSSLTRFVCLPPLSFQSGGAPYLLFIYFQKGFEVRKFFGDGQERATKVGFP